MLVGQGEILWSETVLDWDRRTRENELKDEHKIEAHLVLLVVNGSLKKKKLDDW